VREGGGGRGAGRAGCAARAIPPRAARPPAAARPPPSPFNRSQGKKQPSRLRALASALFSRRAALLWLLWAVWLALVLVSRDAAGDATPFDPWDILKLERSATPADVKRAYRKMSLIYHPDKNPDPEATKYFAESVTKAYKALTGVRERGGERRGGGGGVSPARDDPPFPPLPPLRRRLARKL